MAMLTNYPQEDSLDNRVEDYLDDKLQSTTDLDSLDELLANVELQRNQLQNQLDDALKELEEARRTTEDRQGDLQARIQEFQELQESIEKKKIANEESDAPSEAIERLKAPLGQWQTVKIAQKYLRLLQDVDKWSSEARSHLPGDPKAALEPYSELKQLVSTLKELQEHYGVPGLHLVAYVDGVTESLWDEMKKITSGELENMLTKRNWPKVDPESQMDDEWITSIEKLLDLQTPEVLISSRSVPLLPFEIMSKIFVAEFRFHFLSDKPTSDPQNIGSHCFPWFLALVEKWEDFFRDNLGHLLADKFSETPVDSNMLYIDPVSAFITALLPVMREKVRAVSQKAATNASFLSNFISQLMTFDEDIRYKFSYDGGDAERGWPGLTTEVLNDLFDTWFNAEKDFSFQRFHTILDSDEARKIDYDYAADGRMKPTFAAVQIIDLLGNITNQYKRLRKVKHKTQFLIQIQLDILEAYDGQLRGSLELYQSVTSTIGRTLHGVSKEQMAAVEGTGALDVLCRVLGSADHVVNTLKDWSNEEFFLEFWEQLQSRPPPQGQESLGFEQVKGRTSSVMGEGTDDGALFDEMVAVFDRRRGVAQDLLIAAVIDSHTKAFRSYANRAQFTVVDNSGTLDNDQLSVSAELDELLHVIRRNLTFLQQAVSTTYFRRIFRAALSKLQEQLWNDIISKQSFTGFGAAQLQRDVSALAAVIDSYVPNASGTMGSIHGGIRLLTLPLEAEGSGMTLRRASDGVFKDNDAAREVLEDLGIESLTPQNARNILQRRVENSEDIDW